MFKLISSYCITKMVVDDYGFKFKVKIVVGDYGFKFKVKIIVGDYGFLKL